jgi:hypothetical protein
LPAGGWEKEQAGRSKFFTTFTYFICLFVAVDLRYFLRFFKKMKLAFLITKIKMPIFPLWGDNGLELCF